MLEGLGVALKNTKDGRSLCSGGGGSAHAHFVPRNSNSVQQRSSAERPIRLFLDLSHACTGGGRGWRGRRGRGGVCVCVCSEVPRYLAL